MGDLPLLLPACRRQRLAPLLSLLLEGGIPAVIVDQPLDSEFADTRDHAVEEGPVVRHQDHGSRIGAQIVLQPHDGLEVEVVGRLVKKQHGRAQEQQLRQRDPHLPSAAELVGQPASVALGEPEPRQHLRGPGIDREPVPGLELVLKNRVLAQHAVVHGTLIRQRRHLVLERPHAFLDAREVSEHGQDLVKERPAGQCQTLLRQVTVCRALGACDASAVGGKLPLDETQERGLAGAVGPDQTNPVGIAHSPVQILEERLSREGY